MKYIEYKLNLILVVILSILSSLTSVLFPLCLMRISDSMLQGDINIFYTNILIGLIVVVLQMLLYYVVERAQNKYVKNNIIKIRSDIVKNLLNMTYDEFTNRQKSEYTSLLLNDIKTLEVDFYSSILNLISKGLMLVFSLIGLCTINPSFLLIILGVILLMGLLPICFSNTILKCREKYMLLNSTFTESINECLDGFKTIKSYNIINVFFNRYASKVDKFEESNRKMKNVIALANSIFGVTTMIISLSIFTVGGYLVINNKVTIGGLIATIQLLMYIIEPATNIAESYNSINSTKPIRDRIIDICNNGKQEENNIYDNAVSEIDNIVIDNLTYKYKNNDEAALEDVSFTFEAGKKYAIIGENGSGKSTLLKVIGNIITDYQGTVSINGIDYKALSPDEVYNVLSFVHQNDFLFNCSVKDNILLFDSKMDKEEDINMLLDVLTLNNKLKSCINNSDYTIGYNGEQLSGGEKQKISIMRALLNPKPVLLLDEANSDLDPASSKKILEVVGELKDVLSVVVTHKIDSSLKKFDRIIVLEKGKIINCLSYDELELNNMLQTQ